MQFAVCGVDSFQILKRSLGDCFGTGLEHSAAVRGHLEKDQLVVDRRGILAGFGISVATAGCRNSGWEGGDVDRLAAGTGSSWEVQIYKQLAWSWDLNQYSSVGL